MSKFNWSVRNTLIQDEAVKGRLQALTDITFIPEGITVTPIFTCARLNIGNRFFIVKTKSLSWLETELNRCLKSYNINGLKADNMFLPIIKYIHNNGYYEIEVRPIIQSDNAYKVIKSEYVALKQAQGNTKCLNQSFEPYTPVFNSKTGMFGWLTVNQFLNYKKFVKNEQRGIVYEGGI